MKVAGFVVSHVMMALLLTVGLLFLNGCAKAKFKDLSSKDCVAERVDGGVLISCPDSEEFLPDGVDGRDGSDGKDGIDGTDGADGKDGTDGVDGADGSNAIIEIIDPCGDDPGKFDEVILRLSTGELIAYFEDGGKRFLTSIEPGHYRTTDKQKCYFTVHADGTVTW